jgi:hypothetical protein
MKRIILLMAIAGMVFSCKNASVDFDDFDEQTIYFPIQYPIRTLSLGNDLVDNSLDRAHKFHIGVSVGGYYNRNDRDWRVNFAVDPSLVPDRALVRNGDTLKPLPPAYYTLNPSSTVTIPKGSFSGLIEVQLTDAFFNDPAALSGEYVIPLRIIDSPDTENILRGKASADPQWDGDLHDPSKWEVLPKDYTLFGIKYVNPYHGKWLRRGKLTVRNMEGQIIDTKVYHAPYVEQDEVVALAAASMQTVTSSMNIDAERFNLLLDIAANGEIAIRSLPASPVTVTYGTGLYKENGDTWGGTPEKPTPRDALYLNYFYRRTTGSTPFVCEVSDTLVFRDRGIVYEDERPTVISLRENFSPRVENFSPRVEDFSPRVENSSPSGNTPHPPRLAPLLAFSF